MTALREAAQQALEALTSRDGDGWTRRFARDRAIEALEAALAEPVQPETMTLQEVWNAAGGNSGIKPTKKEVLDTLRLLDEVCDEAEPVQEPRTIRMERVDKSTSPHWWSETARIRMPSPELFAAGDAVLCWVNEGDMLMAGFPEKKPVQEPVAWQWLDTGIFRKKLPKTAERCAWNPLYTAPQHRGPLTDEEIDAITDQQWAANNHKPIYAAHRAYARAVESAHGIKEET